MIGQVIGGYKIQEVVGRGGMGVVFKAVDTSLDKVVALKALDPVQAQSEQFLGRFRAEARMLGRLQHPNIVNVFAFRHIEPHLFIVMEFIGGGSLSDLISTQGALSWREAVPIMRQSMDAIAFAHKQGVIHRDIKPRNIMLTRAGAVKVTDFGLAKIQEASEGSGLTRTGITAGTLYYMPPEQLEGLSHVDHRGDVYSLGMTFYEMLAGRVPFDKQKSDFKILRSIDEHDFPSIEHFVPSVPKRLAEIVSKAVEHDVDKRFQSVDEMLEALQAWEAEAGDAPEPAGPSASALAATRILERSPLAPPDPSAKGDSSSLLKSLKLLLKDASGNWRVSSGLSDKSDSGVEGGGRDSSGSWADSAKPLEGATMLVSAPSKAPKAAPRDASSGRPAIERASAHAAPVVTSTKRRRRWPALLLVALAAVAAVYFLYPEVWPGADSVTAMVPFSVRTQPADAEVYLDDRRIGTTPLVNVEAAAGEHALRVEKEGFAPLDTMIALRAGGTPALSLALTAAGATGDGLATETTDEEADEATGDADLEAGAEEATLGRATVQSTPSGADVLIDGRRLGTTPYTAADLAPGAHRIVVRKEGHAEYAASLNVEAGGTASVDARLTPLRGTLRVLVRPYGDIYVNGEKKKSETNAAHTEELPAGTHRVRAVHPVLGTWEKEVTVQGDARTEVRFDFTETYRVTVVSEPRNAMIVVDGRAIGRNTPSQVPLPPGRHTIEVRKEGFVMEGRPQTITLEQDRTTNALRFQLRAR